MARSVVAPIDRVKLLIQTSFMVNQGQGVAQAVGAGGAVNPALAMPKEHTGIVRTFNSILRNEGVGSLWRGNAINCVRVFPYAGLQFASYEKYRGLMMDLASWQGTDFGVIHRLMAGGMAGATAASFTHPLDVMRVRMAVHSELKGIRPLIRGIMADGGMWGFTKGYGATMLSISPFIAVNFAAFDTLKQWHADRTVGPQSKMSILGLGAASGLVAQTICFPLDTVRRRMQLKGNNYTSITNAFATIFKKEGAAGFYKGIAPNALKIVPNNGIRFLAYSYLTVAMGVPPRKKKR